LLTPGAIGIRYGLSEELGPVVTGAAPSADDTASSGTTTPAAAEVASRERVSMQEPLIGGV
jgi:hypothetical protein